MRPLALLCFLGLLVCGAVRAEPLAPLSRAQAAVLADPASHAVPTVVALWSSDCPHCKSNLKLFADMVRAEPRLRLITVATEPVAGDLDAPLDRLAVPGKRYAYGAEMPETISYALDPKWRGELPRTLLFDGRGGKAVRSGVLTDSQARQALGL